MDILVKMIQTPVTQAIGLIGEKEKIFLESMCDGLMNYFWSNNWVRWLFIRYSSLKPKLKPDDVMKKPDIK